jgi:hypothetical protein
MAAPNLLSPTSINGKTTAKNLSVTTEELWFANSASSGRAYRIASLYAVNVDGTNAVDCTIRLYDNATSGGTAYPLVYTVSIPAGATVTVVTADAFIYMEENTRLTVQASATNSLTVVCSYEDIT